MSVKISLKLLIGKTMTSEVHEPLHDFATGFKIQKQFHIVLNNSLLLLSE